MFKNKKFEPISNKFSLRRICCCLNFQRIKMLSTLLVFCGKQWKLHVALISSTVKTRVFFNFKMTEPTLTDFFEVVLNLFSWQLQ